MRSLAGYRPKGYQEIPWCYQLCHCDRRGCIGWPKHGVGTSRARGVPARIHSARAVRADGSVVVAQAYNGTTNRAFLWRTQMQDFPNLMLSFPELANDTGVAVAQQQRLAGRLMQQACQADGDQVCPSGGSELVDT